MIVYDLSCSNGHRFEGWFGSSSDFDDQRKRGLVSCPNCGSAQVGKAPMAPAVPSKGNSRTSEPARQSSGGEAVSGGDLPEPVKRAMEVLAKAQAEAIKSSEYVGEKFAEQSRAIHYGEREKATIHGKATPEETRELLEEGIEVAPLLIPFTPPEDIN